MAWNTGEVMIREWRQPGGRFFTAKLKHIVHHTTVTCETFRFLLEWQSFMYRYVPHGLLMFPPQKINERAPLFRYVEEF